jgi:hypothetical protein
MDTVIFGLIMATFISMATTKRWLALGFFFASLSACAVLFSLHVTSSLNLTF